MKTFTIQQEQLDEKGEVIKIDDGKKLIEIKGDVREEFCIDDLTNQISLVEGQINNIKLAGEEGDGKEIESLFAEMEKYKSKIEEVNKELGLKVKVPKIKTAKQIEDRFKPIILEDDPR
jgi:hypothetical protein